MRAARPEWATEPTWSALGLADNGSLERLREGYAELVGPAVLRVPASETADGFRAVTGGLQSPALVEGGGLHWRAASWSLDHLVSVLAGEPVICGLTTGGDEVWVPFADFADYAQTQRHDGPLYVFNDEWGGAAEALLADYVPPEWAGNLRAHTPAHPRPPYRWLLVGPRRSGSTVHVDPLGTSAWNAVVSGEKLWTLWEPSDATARSLRRATEGAWSDIPTVYFGRLLEAIQAGACPQPRVLVQRPGDILLVPAGWLHGALNVTTAIAVTENFMVE